MIIYRQKNQLYGTGRRWIFGKDNLQTLNYGEVKQEIWYNKLQ